MYCARSSFMNPPLCRFACSVSHGVRVVHSANRIRIRSDFRWREVLNRWVFAR